MKRNYRHMHNAFLASPALITQKKRQLVQERQLVQCANQRVTEL